MKWAFFNLKILVASRLNFGKKNFSRDGKKCHPHLPTLFRWLHKFPISLLYIWFFFALHRFSVIWYTSIHNNLLRGVGVDGWTLGSWFPAIETLWCTVLTSYGTLPTLAKIMDSFLMEKYSSGKGWQFLFRRSRAYSTFYYGAKILEFFFKSPNKFFITTFLGTGKIS